MKICSYLPEKKLLNQDLEYLGWPAEKVWEKTGIKQRHVVAADEYALDLAEKACLRLFSQFSGIENKIDYLIYCTQSPDSILPNNASLLHKKLNLRRQIGSVDINQGCTGFIYGLSLAKGLLASNQASCILLITTDTYTRYIDPDDRANRIIFGDGATASIIEKNAGIDIREFSFLTEGAGADHLTVKNSGLRNDPQDLKANCLYMNGPEIFNLVLQEVPALIEEYLIKNKLQLNDIDHFIFHQANLFMLEHLRKKLGIDKHKFPIYLEDIGNTVSSSIPLVLEDLNMRNQLIKGQKIMLVGFGIGFSCALTVIEYN